MKLTLLLLTVITVTRAAETFSQKVSLSVKDQPLERVIEQIGRQSGYAFLYDAALLKEARPVTVQAKNVTVESLLPRVFEQQPFNYEIDGKTILLSPKARQAAEPKATKPQPDPGQSIRGTVRDSTGAPLPGVSVLVKGTRTGTITSEQGWYELSGIEAESVLRFSMIGYEPAEIAVQGRSQIDVTLREANLKLAEVAILNTGFELVPAERATGSFGFVDNKLYNRQVSTDVLSRLKAIVPSLLFDERTGTTKLSIRGRSTILANEEPLIVVDNFPFEGNINSINPNDIESVSILKDAAAASIWGVRAGNGVIVITTKRGNWNTKPKVAVNSNVTVGGKPDQFYLPKMSVGEFIDMETDLFSKGKYNSDLANTTTRRPVSPVAEILAEQRSGSITEAQAQEKIDALRKYDVRNDIDKYLYQRSVNQQYALSLNGGTDKHSYFVSAGYDKNIAAQKGNGYERFSLNVNNVFRPVRNLEASVNLIFTQSKNQVNQVAKNLGASSSMEVFPYTRLADDEGNATEIIKDYRTSYKQRATAGGLLDWAYRPLEELALADQSSRQRSNRVNSSVKYTLLPGVSAELRYQYQGQQTAYRNLQTQQSYYTRNMINRFSQVTASGIVRNIPLGDILSTSDDQLTAHNGRFQLTADRAFGKHAVNALAGIDVRRVSTAGYSALFYGYDGSIGSFATVNYDSTFQTLPTSSASISVPSAISGTEDRFRSYFGNAAYTYDSKYTLSVSVRRDESNLFGVESNQRGVPLWSAGVSWNLTQEPFGPVLFSLLKVRATYGYNGNFDNTVTAFTTARYAGNSYWVRQPYATLVNPPNSKLRWEKNRVVNLGVDFKTRSQVFSGSIDYYMKKGTDLMGYGPLNATTGFATYKGNIAGMKGRGLDVELNVSAFRNKRFGWDMTFFLNYVYDRITDYSLKPDVSNVFTDYSGMLASSIVYTPIVGKPLFGIYSYRWAGLSAEKGDPLGYLNGEASNVYSALLQSPLDSLVYHGRATPPVFGAIRNTIHYGPLQLSFNISYKLGYYFRRTSVNYGNLITNNTSHSDYSFRWQQPGDEAKTDVPSMVYPSNSSRNLFYSRSSALVEKGDHIRLQDIQLSYQYVGKKGSWIGSAEVYTYLNNVGILWRSNRHRIDPDYGNLIPTPRSIALGIRANF